MTLFGEGNMPINFEKNKAPWTPKQVEYINRLQLDPGMHPFTCPNRGDENHAWHGQDLGALVATPTGWICVYCDYTQDWAFQFMLP